MTHPALIERITRSLAYMLRHQPEEFDLPVDEYGWAAVEDVLHALNGRLGEPVAEEDVRDAVESGDRQRYEIAGGRIRALYGHSIEVLPGEPSRPPELLYVGVSRADADRARRYGLRPGRRKFLHLALTPEDAMETARRTAREHEVLTVRALDAWEEGINFYDRRSLFLSDPIPTQFLEGGSVGAARGGRSGPREAPVRHAREEIVYAPEGDLEYAEEEGFAEADTGVHADHEDAGHEDAFEGEPEFVEGGDVAPASGFGASRDEGFRPAGAGEREPRSGFEGGEQRGRRRRGRRGGRRDERGAPGASAPRATAGPGELGGGFGGAPRERGHHDHGGPGGQGGHREHGGHGERRPRGESFERSPRSGPMEHGSRGPRSEPMERGPRGEPMEHGPRSPRGEPMEYGARGEHREGPGHRPEHGGGRDRGPRGGGRGEDRGPRHERPFEHGPREERPREDRHREERHREERHRDDRPFERPHPHRPAPPAQRHDEIPRPQAPRERRPERAAESLSDSFGVGVFEGAGHAPAARTERPAPPPPPPAHREPPPPPPRREPEPDEGGGFGAGVA